MKKILAALSAIAITGCVAIEKPLTASELKQASEKNIAASTRVYKNTTPSQIQDASIKVFDLMDKPDIKYDIQGSDLLATRFSTYYAVFSVGFGRDWYSVNISQEKNGVAVRFASYGEMSQGLIAVPPPQSFKSNIPIGSHSNPDDAKLFHDRLEYMLGINSSWISCSDAKARAEIKGKPMMLCDSLGIEDLSPQQASK